MEKIITGKYFTDIQRELLLEGGLKFVYDSLKNLNLTKEQIKQFMNFELKFIIDEKTDEIFIQKCNKYKKTKSNTLVKVVYTFLKKYDLDLDNIKYYRNSISTSNSKYEAFLEEYSIFNKIYDLDVFLEENIIEILKYYYLENIYTINTITKTNAKNILKNAIILKNGYIVSLDYMEHNWAYRILSKFDYTSKSCWTDCTDSVHISSNQISGSCAALLQNVECFQSKYSLSEKQLDILVKFTENLSYYGSEYDLTNDLLKFHAHNLNKGGKYGNLMFIKKYFPEIKTPEITTNPENIDLKNYCVRTSPKKSLPGVLNSLFDLDDVLNAEKIITNDFEKVKNLKYDNTIHWFYQKFNKGIANGVCHFDSNGFRYSNSTNQFDIVNGEKSNINLNQRALKKLESYAHTLHTFFKNKKIQLEFLVEKYGVITILQLRTFDKPEKPFLKNPVIPNYLLKGKTFKSYTWSQLEVSKTDCLITDKDLPVNEIINKKILIWNNPNEFSHLLALSQSLSIPSIQILEDCSNLPDNFKLDLKCEIGYILPI